MKRAKQLIVVLVLLVGTLVASSVSAEDATWTASYWNNTTLTGDPVLVRQESDIFYEWYRQSPAPGVVNNDFFSARWERNVNFAAGTYEFKGRADDQMRIFIDGRLVIDQWYPSQQNYAKTATGRVYLTAGEHNIVVEYVEYGSHATAQVTWNRVLRPDDNVVAPPAQQEVGPWLGAYYTSSNLQGSPSFYREDAKIDFKWGTDSPAEGWDRDNFSVRWTNEVVFSPGRYRFTAIADDGVRVIINDQILINDWGNNVVHTINKEVTILDPSTSVTVEYREGIGNAEVHVYWVLVYPVGNPGTNTSGQTGGAQPFIKEAVMNTDTAVRPSFSNSAPPIAFVEAGDTVSLAGARSADSAWIRIITPKNVWGWVAASTLDTDYPLDSLQIWRSDW